MTPITMPSPDTFGYPTFARVASWEDFSVGVFAYDQRKALVTMNDSRRGNPKFVTREFHQWSITDLRHGLEWAFERFIEEFGEPIDDTGMVGPVELAGMMEPNRDTWERGWALGR